MQKKITALAVVSLLSSVAFAQTTVTIYGAIDMAYQHKGDDSINTGNSGSYNAIDADGWDASWFGLKGSEDLGNGLSVSFQQELGVVPDVSGSATSQRPSWVQIGGRNWGSIQAGNFFIDEILFNTKGGFANSGYSEKPIITGLYTWANNAVRYNSENYAGFSFSVGYSSNFEWGADDHAVASENTRSWFGNVRFSNGPLFIGVSYANMNSGDGGPFDSADEWTVGASYKFAAANVGLVYDAYSEDAASNSDRDTWRLNVGIPLTAKDDLYLSYTNVQSDHSGANNDVRQHGLGIGYTHHLSRRTSLYTSAYWVDADDTTFIDADKDFLATAQKAFRVGVRHEF